MSFLRDVLTTIAATRAVAGAGLALDELDGLEWQLRDARQELEALRRAVDTSHDRRAILRAYRNNRESLKKDTRSP